MSTAAITSLAILKANWDRDQKDYVENFVPFVAQIVSATPHVPISLAQLQASMRRSFGLNIPQNSLRIILNRAKRRGYVRQNYGVYVPVPERLSSLPFNRVRSRVLREHQALLEKLVRFCEGEYGETWSPEDAENALLRYLADYDVELLGSSVRGAPIAQAGKSPKSSKFIVNAFVRDISDRDPDGFTYLETVVRGNMLANALFLSEVGNVQRRFRRTDIFLDTGFVLKLLGCEGREQEAPAKELADLLYQEQADLRVFDHTLNEIHGILDACEEVLRNPSRYRACGPTVQHFIEGGYTPSDVQLFKTRLDEKLRFYRISAAEKPAYDPEHVIDEKTLESHLQQTVGYRRATARIKDVDSLSAIFRLRRGRVSEFLDDSKAVFVTTNSSLARASRQFFSSILSTSAAPICVTDYILTNLVWLKNPVKASDLPRSHVIANSYAALQPDEELWTRYLDEVEKLEQGHKISPDDSYLLRTSIDAKMALMDLTRGETFDLTEGNLQEILTQVRSKIVAEKQQELAVEKISHKETRQRLDTFESSESDRRIKIASLCSSLASVLVQILFWALFVILALGAYVAFPSRASVTLATSYRLIPSVLLALFLVAGLLNATFGVYLRGLLRPLEVTLRDALIRRIYQWLGL